MEGIFQQTLASLERALRVEHVATFDGLRVCRADDPLDEVLRREDLADFDYIPVRGQDGIVGTLERENARGHRAGESTVAIDQFTMMSAADPLKDFIHGLQGKPYRLVIRHGEVAGIVTRSDIQKLPVRLLIFALITHLEAQMAAAIQASCPDEADWLRLLKANRRAQVERKQSELADARMNLAAIEFTEFGDKRDVLISLGLPNKAERSKNKCTREFNRIMRLRDKVSHAASLPDHPEDLYERLVRPFEAAEWWIAWFDENRQTAL